MGQGQWKGRGKGRNRYLCRSQACELQNCQKVCVDVFKDQVNVIFCFACNTTAENRHTEPLHNTTQHTCYTETDTTTQTWTQEHTHLHGRKYDYTHL